MGQEEGYEVKYVSQKEQKQVITVLTWGNIGVGMKIKYFGLCSTKLDDIHVNLSAVK